jgi:alpha-glucosidase
LRPIFWGESHDPTFWEIDDEFMLGYALLIAPVITDGAQSRTVNLPSGLWYSFWDDECYKGPIRINRIVDIQNIPIFIKSGTILPLEENNRLYLHIYSGETNGFSSHIYQDAGDGYGDYRIDTYHAEIVNKSIVISHTSDGTYPFPYQSIEVVLHSKVIDHAYVDGIELTVHSNSIITKQFDIIDFRFQ